jgi:hypothetical protein
MENKKRAQLLAGIITENQYQKYLDAISDMEELDGQHHVGHYSIEGMKAEEVANKLDAAGIDCTYNVESNAVDVDTDVHYMEILDLLGLDTHDVIYGLEIMDPPRDFIQIAYTKGGKSALLL